MENKESSDHPSNNQIEIIDRAEYENIDNKKVTELWDEIGFHKPLAGFWYRLSFYLFSMVLGIAMAGFWYTVFYPFPESLGYKGAATGLFALFFNVFDLGTHMCMDRYIAESQIKNPAKMVKYIQYFIWYQMITGLIQTTFVSIYALYIVPRTDLAYAIWIMLIHSTTQFPGFLGVFRGVLNSLQHFDKTEILNFVSGELFQRFTEIAFVLWGKYWGRTNPAIGEIMGIAIGATIGLYVDDFIATAFSAYFFQKVMRDKGITVRECFRIGFDWDLVKDTLTFGIKTGIPSVIGLSVQLYELWLWLTFVPQYTTFVSLAAMAGGISGLIGQAKGLRLTMLISESYLNDKKELTQYYISNTFRFAGQIQSFLLAVVLIVLTVLPTVFPAIGLERYILAIPFILPALIREIQQPYTDIADQVVTGTNHPTWLMFIRFVEELMKVLFMTLWIMWLRLPSRFGIDAIIWIMPCGIYPPIIIKTLSSFIYLQKKVLKIKVPWWQAFVAPTISALIIYLIGYIGKVTLFEYFVSINQIILGTVVMILFILGLMAFLFFPLTALLGGWDDENLKQFKKATIMSGPSKILVYPMFKSLELTIPHSPLHNKFKIPSEIATIQAQELLELKHKNASKLKNILEK